MRVLLSDTIFDEVEMSDINLKRLLSRKEVSCLLTEMSAAMDVAAWIKDSSGNILFGVQSPGEELPLVIGGETVGTVCGQGDLAVFHAMVRYAVNAENEKKTLARETLDKYKEITMLYDFSERVALCLNPNEVADLVGAEAKRVINTGHVSVLLQSRDQPDLLQGISAEETSSGVETVRTNEGIRGDVFLSGKAEIVNDVASDPRFIPRRSRVSSLMCSPLRIKDKIIGVIDIASERPHTYKAEDLKLLIALSSQSAASIETARLYEELKNAFFTMVQTLAETIEKRDPYTAGHTKRVMEYSIAIGEEMGLAEEEMVRLRLAAVLHDIGKIGVRDNILLKEAKLTDEEFEAIKKHAVYGEEILSHVYQMKQVIPGVKHHHERYDGSGYPDGRKGEEIDITARIIGVADSFDAMTSDRPYRKGLDLGIALAELKKHTGTQFDPVAARAFLGAYEKGKITL
jgi:putative nucleotidyltransferase with HDIG domain